MVVEKIKQTWYEWIPNWMPIVMAVFGAAWWVSGTVTGMERDIHSLQDQVKEIQQYLREDHKKSYAMPPVAEYPNGDAPRKPETATW